MNAAATIPAETVALVRSGSFAELFVAAEEIAGAQLDAGYEEAAEWYAEPLRRLDAARALLAEVGWERVAEPVPVTIDLDTHRGALLRAARTDLERQKRLVNESAASDETRASAAAGRALLEELIEAVGRRGVMAGYERELAALGRTIRRLRHDRGLSMASLASKAGVSAKNLNRIELGQTNPVLTTLRPLCLALGVPLGEIMSAAEDEAARHGGRGRAPEEFDRRSGHLPADGEGRT